MNGKYYIYAPSNVVTGGQELLHQLCDSLNSKGQEAYIVYYPDPHSAIPAPYRGYNLRTATDVEDRRGNFLVLHESQFDRGFRFRNLTLVHWWLSVDNFFKSSPRYLSVLEYLRLWRPMFVRSVLVKAYYLAFRRNRITRLNVTLGDLRNPDIINYAQSYYAIDFLKRNGFRTFYSLSDYINDKFANRGAARREDVILYNPKKGFEFTRKLIERFRGYKWTPIANMTYEQVCDLMNRSKIYVDFGNHPGKDRLPREAVLAGLCVITGKRGSAYFHDDIPIPDEYKFDETQFDDARFRAVVERIFQDYEREYANFSSYRKTVAESPRQFSDEVDAFIEINARVSRGSREAA